MKSASYFSLLNHPKDLNFQLGRVACKEVDFLSKKCKVKKLPKIQLFIYLIEKVLKFI